MSEEKKVRITPEETSTILTLHEGEECTVLVNTNGESAKIRFENVDMEGDSGADMVLPEGVEILGEIISPADPETGNHQVTVYFKWDIFKEDIKSLLESPAEERGGTIIHIFPIL